jgi:mRNA-degrading endonuclease RelE of RelBE toxin-antitoxin system
MQVGKRSGYRVIYAVDVTGTRCILLYIYAKAEQADVTPAEIERLLADLG